MTKRTIAWITWGGAMAFAIAGLGLLALTWDVSVPDAWGFRGFAAFPAIGFGTFGLLIALRRPNTIGWLLLFMGVAGGIQTFAEQYGIYGLVAHPGSLPGAVYVASLVSWWWVLTTFTIGIYMPLLFPSGRLPSPRWIPVAALGAIAGLLTILGLGLADGPVLNATYTGNAFAIPGFSGWPISGIGISMWLVATFAAALSVIVRFRGAVGIERQQIKWLAYGTSIAAVGAVAGGISYTKLGQYFFFVAAGAIPITVMIAILRYRLYDIDVLINRTIVYGALSATLAASYVGLVVLFQAVLRPLTGGSEIAVAASTLGTIALFQPLRRRIQAVVDRRFYRGRYDAQRVVDSFTARLRDEVDMDDVRAQLLGAVHATVQPRAASVWVRGERA